VEIDLGQGLGHEAPCMGSSDGPFRARLISPLPFPGLRPGLTESALQAAFTMLSVNFERGTNAGPRI
jgi:hypothetical protein